VTRRPTLSLSEQDEQRAFLRSIQETPGDHAPRLVYADWLDDHGDPDRADFIRTQCRLEATTRDALGWPVLKARESELLRHHRTEWLGPWFGNRNETVFRRGFLSVLHLTANFTIDLPTLSSAVSPYLDLVETLGFRESKLAEGLVARLAVSPPPCLRRLECLICVRGNNILAALAKWPAGTALAELVLRGCEVGPAGLQFLGKAPWLNQIRALDLAGNHISETDLSWLLAAPALQGLEELRYSGARGRRRGAEALVPLWPPGLPALRCLRLRDAEVGREGMIALATSPALLRLETLDLYQCLVQDGGARALAHSANARNLKTLCLRSNHIGYDGVRALAASPHLAGLTCLDLGGNDLGGDRIADIIRAIAESAHLQGLVTLRLDVVRLRQPEIAAPLLAPGRLPRLRDLVLGVITAGSEVVERFRARGVELTTHYHADYP
jgi:uncharacterized protein (TIGR02996 family)